MRRSVAASTMQAVLGPGSGRRWPSRTRARRPDVERLVVDGGHQQLVALFQRHAGHGSSRARNTMRYTPRLEFRGSGRTGGHAGQVQQLDDDVLQHMAHPGALRRRWMKPPRSPTPQWCSIRRAASGQALVEAGNLVGRIVFQLAQIQPDLQYRAVGPDVGAAQVVVRKSWMSLNFAM
jgi:hypothetical protein